MKTAKIKILSVGGGSGGHVSPVVAVIDRLVEQIPNCKITFWCDRGYRDQSAALLEQSIADVKISTIFAGKLRRYHGESFLDKIRDYKTIFHNIFDVFLVVVGFFQSIFKLALYRPEVVFLKGGFVCLPVGYASYLLGIPIVIHDSDTHPGLTNRLLAPLAKKIATGAPLEYYNYPKAKAEYVGIPLRKGFRKLNKKQKNNLKIRLGLDPELPFILVIGGGLGSQKINNTMKEIASTIAGQAQVLHVAGTKHAVELETELKDMRHYKVVDFISQNYPEILNASDIIVSRAGASALAEIAVSNVASILIPHKQLVGDHQTKNAKVLQEGNAAIVISEDTLAKQPHKFLTVLEELIGNEESRAELCKNLQHFAKPNADKKVASMITEILSSKNV